MVIRSLLTLLGFQTDTKQLQAYENTLKGIITFTKMAAVGTIALGTAAFKTAGDMEQIEIAFETMLGNADAANRLIQDITKFAAQTPFELQGLVTSSKQLLAFGFAAENIIPTMRTLGDIAAGVGKDKLETIVRSLGKIRTKGRASMEELNMMLEAGVPILDQLSKNLGVTQAVLFKMISKGQVSFEDVNKALTDMATGTGKFAGLMQKQSKSFLGIMSNIGDFFYNLTASIGKDLLPIGKELAKYFLDFMETNKGIIKAGLVDFFKKIIYAIVFVIRFIQRLIDRFGGLEAIIRVVNKIIQNVGKILMPIAMFVLKVLVFIFDVVNGIVKAFGGWEKVLSVLIPVILAVIAGLKAWAIIQGILNAVMAINPVTLIIAGIIALIAAIILLIVNWEKIITFLKNVWWKFVNWWATLWSGIWKNVGDFFSNIWKSITDFFVSIWNKAKNIVLNIWNSMVNGIKNLWKGFNDFFKNIWNGVFTFFSNIWKGIVNFIIGIVKFFVKLWNGFIGFWKDVWNVISEFFTNIWNGFTAIVSDVWNKAKDIILDIWEKITSGIKNLWEGAVSFVTNLWQGVMDFIEKIKTFGSDVANFFSGLFGGKKELNISERSMPGTTALTGTPMPGIAATAVTERGKAGNTFSINAPTTIEVPAGTPAEQKAFIDKNVNAAIRKSWESIMREGLINMPTVGATQ